MRETKIPLSVPLLSKNLPNEYLKKAHGSQPFPFHPPPPVPLRMYYHLGGIYRLLYMYNLPFQVQVTKEQVQVQVLQGHAENLLEFE